MTKKGNMFRALPCLLIALLALALAPSVFAQVECDTVAEIEAAVAGASTGDEIRIVGGSFTLSAGTTMTLSASTVTLSGGWDATFTTQDYINNPTTLDAGGAHRVLLISDTADDFMLQGLTFTGGDATVPSASAFGGGVYIWANGTVEDCVFLDNYAYRGGGASVMGDAEVTFDACEFTSNTATEANGAELLTNLPNNSGGGLHGQEANITVVNSTFLRNRSYHHGGAFCTTSGSLTLINNTFVDNRLVNGANFGTNVGLAQWSETIAINNIVAHNTVNIAGNKGIWNFVPDAITNTNNLFYDNDGGNPDPGDNANAGDPMLVSITEGSEDLHLTTGSAAADAGSSTFAPTIDKDNDPRPVDGVGSFPPYRYDIGAYEFPYNGPITSLEKIYVKPIASGFGNGQDWDNATTLGGALNNWDNGVSQVIYMAGSQASSYTLDSRYTITHSDLHIIGGYDPSLTGTDLTSPDPTAWPTIIDLNGSTSAFDLQLGGTTFKLENLTFQEGLDTAKQGGLFYYNTGNANNVLDFINCRFLDNTAQEGGVLRMKNNQRLNTMNWVDCYFEGNTASNSGGVFVMDTSTWGTALATFTLTRCDFTNNTAKDGGVLYERRVQGRKYYFTDCTFIDNYATRHGGVVEFNNSEKIYIDNCHFEGNGAENNGATLHFQMDRQAGVNTDIDILNSEFVGNYNIGGKRGAIFLLRTWEDEFTLDFNMQNCFVHGNGSNVAPDASGLTLIDFWVGPSELTVTDITIQNNVFADNITTETGWPTGSLLLLKDFNERFADGNLSVNVSNNTFVGNVARDRIIYGDNNSTTPLTIANNLFAYNSVGDRVVRDVPELTNCFFTSTTNVNTGTQREHWDGVGAVVNCIPDTNTVEPATLGLDVMLVNYMGNTAEDFQLQAGSAAIDQGTSQGLVPSVDYWGTSRPVDGDGDTVADWDIGAYEYEPLPEINYTTPFDMGGALNNTLTTAAMTVTNTGEAALNISAVNFVSGDSNFSVESFDATIPAGGSGEIVFGITSSVEGATSANFSIVSNDTASPSAVEVLVEVLGAPSLEVTVNQPPWSIDHQDGWVGAHNPYISFRNVLAGQSRTLSYELRAEAITDDVVIEAPAPYSVSIDNVNFSNDLSLTPVGYIVDETVYVKFAPTAPGFYFGDDTGEFQTYVVDNTVAAESLASVVSLGGYSGISRPVYEPFDYATGELVGSSNDTYVEAGGGTGDTSLVIDGNLSYPGLVPPSGRSAILTSGTKPAQAAFYPNLSSETLAASDGLYYSMLLRANELPGAESTDGKRVFSLLMDKSNYNHFAAQGWAQNSLSMYERGTLVARTTDTGYELGVSTRYNDMTNTEWWPTELNSGQTYFIVVQYHPSDDHPANDKSTPVATSDTVTLWVNPTVGAVDPALETSVTYEWQTGDEIIDQDCEMNGWVLYNELDFDSGEAAFQIDEIRIGQTWADVNVEYTGPQIWYVDDDATAPMDGLSWDTAYDTITSGLAAASDGDQVWVAAGTYPESNLDPSSGAFIYGGFAGTEGPFTDLDDRDFAANASILDGSTLGSSVYAIQFFGDSDVIFDGFTVTKYHRSGGSGAVQVMGGSSNITISNVTIFDNKSSNIGGGMSINSGAGANTNIVVSDCVISSNVTRNWAAGAGIWVNPNNTLTVLDTVFSGNGTKSPSNYNGGAIWSSANTLVVKRSRFEDNKGFWGAGIYLEGSCNFTIENCMFWQNDPGNSSDVYMGGSATGSITHCTFDSTVYDWGGQATIQYNADQTLSFVNNIISNCGRGINATAGTINADTTYFFSNEGDTNVGTNGTLNETNSITGADPLYVNGAAGNLHLEIDSPAVDAAAATSVVEDYDGEDRPFNGTADIGADEVVPAASVDSVIWTLY